MLNSNDEKKEKKPFTIATTDMIKSPPPTYEQWEQGELRKAMQEAIGKRPKVGIPGPKTPTRKVRKLPASLGPRPRAPPRKKVTGGKRKRKRKRTRKKRKRKSTRKKKKKKKKRTRKRN